MTGHQTATVEGAMAIRTELRDGNQVEVVGDDFAEVVSVFSPNLSRDGVFVETDVWLADGSPVRFRLSLADGFALVHALGEVAWRRSAAERKAGLAIRFSRVVEGLPLIERIVDQHRLEGGQPFLLSDPAARQDARPSPGAPSEGRGAPDASHGMDRMPDLGGGLEILDTLEEHRAPKFAPGLGRAGDLGADPRVRIARNVIASLGGAEEEPAPPPPAPAPEPRLDQSVADLRSLLGDDRARADVLTSTVSKETPASPFATQVMRRGDLKSAFGDSSRGPRLDLRTPVPATRSGRPPASGASSREGSRPRLASEKEGASADRRELRDLDRLDEIGAEEPPTPRPGQELRLDPALLGGEPGTASETGEAEGSSTKSQGGQTDPLISASWLLDRWENIEGKASGPPSSDPELKRGTGPIRPGAAASARGTSGLPIVPLVVVVVLGVAGYLAVQRWYLARPKATPASVDSAATEVVDGTAAEPELASAEPGRTLAAIRSRPRTGEPAIEVADGALDGLPAGVLQRVTWDVGSGETRILLEGDGAFSAESVTVVRIPAAPPRVLLRISGILRPVEPPRYQIDSPQVTSLRFGFHQEGSAREAHVVIDLATPNARLRLVRLAPQRLVLVVSGAAR